MISPADDCPRPSGAVNWVGAVTTVSAVVFALWFQWWRAHQRRPKLTLEFDDEADRANVEDSGSVSLHLMA